MKPKKIALMDRFGKKFTEGDNFKLYAKAFLKYNCTVVQLDPYTINFNTKTGKTYRLNMKKNFKRNDTYNISNLESFDIIMDLSDIVNLNFAKKLNKINILHVNSPIKTYHSADKKTYVKNYPEFIPKTIISSDIEKLEKALIEEFGGTMIVKNPFGYCGRDVEKISTKNKNYIEKLNQITKNGKIEIVAQKFMHFAKEGSKRVAVVGKVGEKNSYKILHFYGRKPSKGNWKDNLAQGGQIIEIPKLREDEKELCLNIAYKSGLYLVGLDIMDDLDEKGNRIPRMVETNAVLVCSGNGKYPEKIEEVVKFILEEL